MSFKSLKQHKFYNKINIRNYRAIVEEKIQKVENDIVNKDYEISRLKSSVKDLQSKGQKALQEFESITAVIAFAVGRPTYSSGGFKSSVRCIENEDKFKNLGGLLDSLHSNLERISQ